VIRSIVFCSDIDIDPLAIPPSLFDICGEFTISATRREAAYDILTSGMKPGALLHSLVSLGFTGADSARLLNRAFRADPIYFGLDG